MSRLDPEALFIAALVIGAVHLLCAVRVGMSLLREGPGPGWPRARQGLRFHALAGMGLGVVAGVVAWRVSPGRVTASDSWVMLLGLALAALGQGGLLRALAAGGAFRPPGADEGRLPRLYIALTPVVVFVLIGILFALRGVR